MFNLIAKSRFLTLLHAVLVCFVFFFTHFDYFFIPDRVTLDDFSVSHDRVNDHFCRKMSSDYIVL